MVGEILTSMLFSVLKYIRSCSLLNAWFGYWKLKVENGDSGSSKMSKSAISFSSFVSLGTPICQKKKKKEYESCFQKQTNKTSQTYKQPWRQHWESPEKLWFPKATIYPNQPHSSCNGTQLPDSHTQVVIVPSSETATCTLEWYPAPSPVGIWVGRMNL